MTDEGYFMPMWNGICIRITIGRMFSSVYVVFGIESIKKLVLIYHIAGKFGGGEFGKFGESSVIRQTKIIQIST